LRILFAASRSFIESVVKPRPFRGSGYKTPDQS